MAGSQWCFDDFCLDPDNARLWHGTQVVALTPKAFDVLHYLVTHADRLVSKDALLDAVWPETVVSDGVVRMAIGEVRKALGDTAQAPRYIATVQRRGYRFVAPVTDATGADGPVSGVASWSPDLSLPMPLHSFVPPPPLLVGREPVLASLHAALAQARQGQRQMLFLTGEPGMGKTAVVEAFTAQAHQDPTVDVALGQCIEQYGPGEPYMPVLEALGQLGRGPEGTRVVTLLRQQAPTWLAQMPWLLTPAERLTLQQELQGSTRERMLRELARLVATLTTERLLVLVLEDLHWSDHATLDALTILAQSREPARLLLIGTYRPVEVIVHEHPLRPVVQHLQLHGQSQALPLEPLGTAAVAAYLAARCPGAALPEALPQWLVQCTEGNPLFVVQVVAQLMAQGVLVEQGGQWTCTAQVAALDTLGVPETLRQLIASQCARLTPVEQAVLAAGSVAGLEFLSAAVAPGLDTAVTVVETHCDELVQRGQVLRSAGVLTWPDGTVTARYAFQHALYQQVLYEQLGAARRLYLHRQIGARLAAAYGERAGEVAAELAEHFARGQVTDRAVPYLRQAADTARARHAHHEAIAHLRRALEALGTLPDTAVRRHQELSLYVALGPSLLITHGEEAPEVEQAYGRAYALCQQVEDTALLLPVLAGLQRFYMVRAAHQRCLEVGERLLHLAERLDDQAFLLEAHGGLSATRQIFGHFGAALAHQEQVIARYVPRPSRSVGISQDLNVSCLAGAARALWCLGYPDRALARNQEAIAFAQHLAHPYSLAWSQQFMAEIHQYRGEGQAALQMAEASLALAAAQGFQAWLVRGLVVRGLALTRLGRTAEGIAQMQQGLETQRTTGATRGQAYFLTQLAEVYLRIDQPAASLACLTEALALIEATGERWWEAEYHRIYGALLAVQARAADTTAEALHLQGEAEACLHRALALAREQEARSLELRAATGLARLWQQQGKRGAALALAAVYDWFTEGFATADLQQARALLGTLAD